MVRSVMSARQQPASYRDDIVQTTQLAEYEESTLIDVVQALYCPLQRQRRINVTSLSDSVDEDDRQVGS